MFWNYCVVILLVCILQALSYFWLNSLYDFKVNKALSLQFAGCFDIGAGFTALGVTLMLLQECGLTLGTLCTLTSVIFMLETMSVQDSNTTELLIPTLGGLLLFGKGLRSLGEARGSESAEDEPDNVVHMKSLINKAWTFMRTKVFPAILQHCNWMNESLHKHLQRDFKMAAPLLAIIACFVLTITVASLGSVRLALVFDLLHLMSWFWLVSCFDFNWNTVTVRNRSFALCLKFGLGSTLLGPFMLFIPSIGFNIFSLLYTAGTVSLLSSIYFLTQKGQTVNIEDAVSRLIVWIKTKTKVGVLDSGATKWVNGLDFYHSDIGGIAEGLCALLFPALGLLFGAGHVVWALKGQKKKTPPVKPPVNNAKKQQGLRNESDKKLDELQHTVMKVFRFVILGTVLWLWGFSLFVWTCSCLLLGVFVSLHHKPSNIGFIACFIVGALCTVLGVYLLDQQESGLTLFSIFYTVGNVCVLGSTLFVVDLWQQLKMAFDKVRAVASSVMILFLVLTLFAALWWRSFIVALAFCFLHIVSSIWYCLTYVQYSRRVFTFYELMKEE